MGKPFDFSNINNVYVAARQNDRQTVVFEVLNGRGVFVFMMFFSEEDHSKDQLFLYLARTARMITLKMYGRHEIHEPETNKFLVYLKTQDQAYILEELGLEGGGRGFDFDEFLKGLNESIPQTLSFADLQKNCRTHRDAFGQPELRRVVDSANKIYLIGPMQLDAAKRPREKTLRKLYLHISAEPDVLERFIAELKHRNMTVAWTDTERPHGDIRQMLARLR
ncbi:hypothetical protein [Pseudomonas viridiflava]|uniref:hypothetical protein n=1 Tax=Pseudomonas viridiflava TaxID=33069 RepID=UPI002E9AF131|nr:hypothetical protein [Pseudomonas viridiflava]MEE3930152.1 hypothetical protein [Pseudomonas viridiflava]MEE3940376.1 hypothetical protein [Pseudomonas viridiflava]MEE3966389.1 hypothetical protein [Pseudomonas viridiflava]MEE3980509.1 hypothetical protein [Pseudomonas viridiflava]